jgi:transcription elongation GreA/GreB family factor
MHEPKSHEPKTPRSREANRQSPAWHVPVAVEDVAEAGSHFELAANAEVRAAVAKLAGLRDLPRFTASFDVTRRGAGLHVVGRVSATVGQSCVVTLEPLVNEVDETIDLVFAPQPLVAAPSESTEARDGLGEEGADGPEPLVGGRVDLGALATEFLILGLDPYPRKAGAIFQPPQDVTPQQGPFAALADLKKGGHEG